MELVAFLYWANVVLIRFNQLGHQEVWSYFIST